MDSGFVVTVLSGIRSVGAFTYPLEIAEILVKKKGKSGFVEKLAFAVRFETEFISEVFARL